MPAKAFDKAPERRRIPAFLLLLTCKTEKLLLALDTVSYVLS